MCISDIEKFAQLFRGRRESSFFRSCVEHSNLFVEFNGSALSVESRDFVKHFRAMSTRVRGEMPCKGTRNSHHHPGRNDKVSRKKNIFLSDPVGCRLSRCNRKCSSFFFARFYRHCQWWGIHCANTSWIPFQFFFLSLTLSDFLSLGLTLERLLKSLREGR